MEPKPPRPVQTAADFSVQGGAMELIDRDAERDTLDRFVVAASRRRGSGSLVTPTRYPGERRSTRRQIETSRKSRKAPGAAERY